jgi:hypothetical protein
MMTNNCVYRGFKPDSSEAEYLSSIRKLNARYVNELPSLQERLTKSGDLDGALAVRDEIARIKGTQTITDDVAQLFIWKSIKAKTTYSYSKKWTDSKLGAFDYGDNTCEKLLNGKVSDNLSPDCVGWYMLDPSPLIVKYPRKVKPSFLRVHILGKGSAVGVGTPRSIKVTDIGGIVRGEVIGTTSQIINRTDWVEVPLTFRHATDSIEVTIEKGEEPYVLVDEIEFR